MPLFFQTRILRAAAQNASAIKWSETLALPKSTFPARPTAAQLEQYRQRCADDLYSWQRANRPQTIRTGKKGKGKEVNNEFILHDGPPYANGAVHAGHALNKVLKDMVMRWHLATGKRVQYTPGWDCHGLPIELKALQAQRTKTEQAGALEDVPKQEAAVATGTGMSASEIRKAARELASETIEKQKVSFRGWGVMGEWEKPYKTMDLEFEVRQLGVFREMVKNGLISRHHRPVYWSPSSRTALAEAELEYDENHKCTAAFVKMPFARLPHALKSNEALKSGNLSAVIWTTTPWTLPANRAIAVNEKIQYIIVTITYPGVPPRETNEDFLLVARDRVDYVMSHLPKGAEYSVVLDPLMGSELADGNACCFNIFSASESPLLKADFVTAASGTGLVHSAPGHGMEDYQLCVQNNIGPAFAPVDERGRYTADVFPAAGPDTPLTGSDVQSEGAEAALNILRDAKEYLPSGMQSSGTNLVLAAHEFTHKNPIDWRTKGPVIVRATAQWFADVSAIKDRALASLEDVTFIPDTGKTRLKSFVEGRSQWCISRQRAWGVPIPALYHQETGEACIREESIDHIIETIKQRGTDAWFSDSPDHPAWVHPSLAEDPWVRGKDTMDVWFDSGTTWTIFPARDGKPVSDVYLEGTDQHRGWFQSSLLTAVSTQDSEEEPIAPFGELVTHGFILDAEGRKMSKSIGNVISPDQILDGSLLPPMKAKKQRGKPKASVVEVDDTKYDAMGPDVLRLWVASSDYTRDVSISVPVLQSVQQALQKLRVTFKFLLGVLEDYKPSSAQETSTEQLNFADRAVLHQLCTTSRDAWKAYKKYQFYKVVNEINTFVSNDLSAFYFEVIKDTMYAGSNTVRQRTQGVLKIILDELLKMLGPITPHLIEEVWEHAPADLKSEVEHPLKVVWTGPYHSPDYGNRGAWDEVCNDFGLFSSISSAVKLAQEAARTAGKLRSGLACKVQIQVPDLVTAPSVFDFIAEWEDSEKEAELTDLLVVSQAEAFVVEQEDDNGLVIKPPSFEESAWRFEQSFIVHYGDAKGRVVVMPPEKEKCVRCWKYTAEEKDVPCERCRHVLTEMGRDAG